MIAAAAIRSVAVPWPAERAQLEKQLSVIEFGGEHCRPPRTQRFHSDQDHRRADQERTGGDRTSETALVRTNSRTGGAASRRHALTHSIPGTNVRAREEYDHTGARSVVAGRGAVAACVLLFIGRWADPGILLHCIDRARETATYTTARRRLARPVSFRGIRNRKKSRSSGRQRVDGRDYQFTRERSG